MTERYTVGVVDGFAARHALRGDFGPATQTHAHRYRVEVAVSGPALRPDGTLCDIAHLGAVARAACAELDDTDLARLDAFRVANSTAERVAAHLAAAVAVALDATGLVSLRVTVWESDAAYAVIERELPARR